MCLFLGTFVASLWISDTVMEWFLWGAQFAYLAFYVGQSIVVIEQAYAVNEYWKEQESLTNLVAGTVAAWVLSLGFLGLTGYLYWNFGGPVVVLLAVTLGQAVVIAGASLLPAFEEGSLLTSSLTGTYLCYLCFNFLRHVPGTESDYWIIASTLTEMVLAFIFIARLVSTWALSHESKGEISKPLVETKTDKKEEEENSREMLVFHALMLLTALFFASSMKTISYRGEIDSEFFLWSKVSIQGLTSLLYLWTLLAPIVLSDREFD